MRDFGCRVSPNIAQAEVIERGLLSSGFSCVLQMPTGSGKTYSSLLAIKQSVLKGHRCIYLSPLRALADELSAKWREHFKEPVGVFTGDYGAGKSKLPVSFHDARVLIMTPERLDACTRNWRSHWGWIPEVDLVVVDEVHLLGDVSRGHHLEGAIARLRRLNPFARFLCLSATLGNRHELADWLEGVEYASTWRPVPLAWRVERYRKADEKVGLLIKEAANTREQSGQTLVFVQSRRRAEQLAQSLGESKLRCSHHHAGLDHAKRRKTEASFRDRELDVLIATGTLEMGLNLPARKVVLYDLQGFDGKEFSPLTVNTVWQRAGRAGRPGIDPAGEAVLFAAAWDRDLPPYESARFEPVVSGLRDPAAFSEQIMVEIQAGFARTRSQLSRAFGGYFAAHQKRLRNVDAPIDQMLENGMLAEKKTAEELFASGDLVVTPLGRVAVRHLLRPATVGLWRDFLKACSRFTHFDVLLVAAASPDCEPLIPADFEELTELAGLLSQQRSQVLRGGDLRLLPACMPRGRRLLTVIKTALLMAEWCNEQSVETLAERYGCYAFELQRLRESMERLLQAMQAVVSVIADPNSEESAFNADRVVRLTHQRVATGLPADAASLTVVDGLGAKWARKFVAAGLRSLPALAKAPLPKLTGMKGLKRRRALTWKMAARREAKDWKPLDERFAPLVETCPVLQITDVDVYRLRRALELKVNHHAVCWSVSGGLEPHQVRQTHQSLHCDCVDYAKGHTCKHIIAVRLSFKDPALQTAADQLRAAEAKPYLDLSQLWFEPATAASSNLS